MLVYQWVSQTNTHARETDLFLEKMLEGYGRQFPLFCYWFVSFVVLGCQQIHIYIYNFIFIYLLYIYVYIYPLWKNIMEGSGLQFLYVFRFLVAFNISFSFTNSY